jgi:hypothetical protein
MTKRLVLLAATALLLPCLATAGTVSFSTTGTFGNGTSTSGVFTGLSFVGASWTNLNAGPPLGNNISFGEFHFTKCTGTCSGSDSFTLHIDQTAPTSGGGDLDATVSGSVTASHGSLFLTLTKATVSIGKVIYTFPIGESINVGHPGKKFAQTSLNGNVLNPVAEPNASLLLGLGTVGLMGLTLVSRKMLTI